MAPPLLPTEIVIPAGETSSSFKNDEKSNVFVYIGI